MTVPSDILHRDQIASSVEELAMKPTAAVRGP